VGTCSDKCPPWTQKRTFLTTHSYTHCVLDVSLGSTATNNSNLHLQTTCTMSEDNSSLSPESKEGEEDFNQPEIKNVDDEPDLSATESAEEAESKGLSLKDLGNEALIAGHYTDAIHLYSTALSHLPNNAIILSNRALAYIKIENYGLAIQDASRAVEVDPTYPKGYYRRGTAEFALGRAKAARKDFRNVCKLKPKDRDARAKLSACDKAVREAAFAAAILSEESAPLSDTFRAESIVVEKGYDGPHPAGYLEEGEGERGLFEPGCLPRDFVMVRDLMCLLLLLLPSTCKLCCILLASVVLTQPTLCIANLYRRQWSTSRTKKSFTNAT
jgi:tetratricopeptide (TPR) repeat protein